MLSRLLAERAEAGRPLRVGLIGAGVFGTMFLAQARRLAGLHVLGVADLNGERARSALVRAGWPPGQTAAGTLDEALRRGTTCVTDNAGALITAGGLDVVVDATGSPSAAIRHALAAFEHGRHVVNVTVEADVLVGPLLAKRAAEAGVVYSLAYGDQPALVCELVEWARVSGFEVVCAGKGTKYLPSYHAATPDTVWAEYGLHPDEAARDGLNPTMFTSFLDGTKSAVEMAAVANATGLLPQAEGLRFPPCGADRLAAVCIPSADGGSLTRRETVEVVSSLERDGSPVPHDLRWGVFVTFEAPSDYVARRFRDYGLATDPTGRYAALYRPYHLIGLELSVSVLRAGLRGEATGAPSSFRADVVAIAKRDLAAGETLDGEGGYRVWGRLRPAEAALAAGALPIGLAHGVGLRNPVAAGETVRWLDVELDERDATVSLRREMERCFLGETSAGAAGGSSRGSERPDR